MSAGDSHIQDAFAEQIYDYVIVGGGTAGLALASLLSSDNTITVGVVEAGIKKEDDLILTPGFIGQSMGKEEYDWGIKSIPQRCAKNREIPMYRGKLLGGTSAMNYMAFIRGSRVEHDDWENLGLTGWDWNTVARLVKLSENWTPPTENAKKHYASDDPENHGRNGFIKTSYHEFYYDITPPFFETMNNLGIPTNKSTSGGNPIGVWTELASIDPDTRTRSYSANAYYEPVKQRQNLEVLTAAEVLSLNLSPAKDSAGNVQVESLRYRANGNFFTVKANKEVILAAGAIQTPAILELSGIGNPEVTKALGVENMIQLPGVGENLQDHINVAVGAALSGDHMTAERLGDPEFLQEQLKLYRETRSGMLSATPSSFAYLRAQDFIPKDRLTNLLKELDKAIRVSAIQQSPWKALYETQKNWLTADNVPQLEIVLFPAYFGPVKSENASGHYTLSLFLQHAWSKGKVHACSVDSTIPTLDLALLDSPADIDAKILVEAVKYAFRIMKTEPLASQTSKIIDPSPDSTDEELLAWVKQTVQSAWHPVGTAAMLPRQNNGVVDNELKVYGTSNLRVVDASIIPIHIGTHPQAFVYGLAHRAAEIIQASK